MKNQFRRLVGKASALTLVTLTAFPSLVHAASGPSGFSYEGRLYTTAGIPSALSVQFILEIYNPSATCLLRREQTGQVDLSQSDGYFSVTVGQGTTMSGDPGLSMAAVFANAGPISGNSCSYTPAAGEGRVLKVSVYDGATTTAMTPNISIGASPYALVADTLQGKAPSDLLQVNSTGAQLTQANLESVFTTAAQVSALQSLSNGTSTAYVKASTTAGSFVPGLASAPSSPVAGQFWYDTVSNTLKYYNGTSTQSLGAGGGTVTSVTAGTGLTGGTFTTSGTISMPNVGVSGSYYKVSTDAQGRVTTGSAALIPSDIPNLPASIINSGTFSAAMLPPAATVWSASGSNPYTLTGNVGVGTSAPAGMVEIDSSAGGVVGLIVKEASAQSANMQEWRNNGGTVLSSVDKNGALFVGSTGSVTTPAIDVGYPGLGLYVPGLNTLAMTTNGVERMRIDASGNVGIGTTSPAYPLDVNGMIRTTSGGYGLYQQASATLVTYTGGGYGVIGTESNHKLALEVNSVDRLTIMPNGNVGIGTTAPTSILEVNPSAATTSSGVGITLTAQSSTFTNGSGGSIALTPGIPNGTGAPGVIKLNGSTVLKSGVGNYVITGVCAAGTPCIDHGGNSVAMATATAINSINCIAVGADGQTLRIVMTNSTASAMTTPFVNNGTCGTGYAKILYPSGVTLTAIASNSSSPLNFGTYSFVYDASAAAWRMFSQL